MNPRRPTPSGPKPDLKSVSKSAERNKHNIVNYSSSTPITDNHVLQQFLKWCLKRGTSEKTCRQYVAYLMKPLEMNNKWSRLAWKAYFKFIGDEGSWKRIKVMRSGIDMYIPSDEDVLKALRKACAASLELCTVYKMLVYSGLRLNEVVRVISEQDQRKWIEVNGFFKYPLSWRRGSKQAFYCYTLEKPPKISCSSKWVSNFTSKNKLLPAKYVRKWVATKMLSLGIPEEIVNFIQGRIPQQILAKHYLKLSTLADQYYGKYVQWLNENLVTPQGPWGR